MSKLFLRTVVALAAALLIAIVFLQSNCVAPTAAIQSKEISHPDNGQTTSRVVLTKVSGNTESDTARKLSRTVGNESVFHAFDAWVDEYRSATATERLAMDDRGFELAHERRAALLELIKSDPEQALQHRRADNDVLPAEIASQLEENISANGYYSVKCVTPVAGQAETQAFERSVTLNGKHYVAHVYGQNQVRVTEPNMQIAGIAIDDDLALIDTGLPRLNFGDPTPGSSDVTNRPLASWTTGNKKVLVIRVDFPDLQGEPIYLYNTDITLTASYCAGIFNNPNGIRDFYQQQSYGKTDLLISEADVTPVYRMPSNSVWYAQGDGSRFYGAEMQAVAYAAAGATYDLTQYDRIALLHTFLGNITNSIMTFAGQGEIGGRYLFINGAFDYSVVSHELGHTYGIYHANWWKPSNNTTIGTEANHLASFTSGAIYGVSIEYGDIFDAMGANSGTTDTRYHFNHWFKNMLNWVPDSNVVTVTNSGTYRIYRFDDPSVDLVNNKFALKICRDQIRDYWVGYRCDFATTTNRAYIVYGYNFNTSAALLDCNTPGSSLSDATLAVSQSLIDTNAGVTITTVAAGGTYPNNYLDIQVSLQPRVAFTSDYVSAETVLGTASVTVERLCNSSGITTVDYTCIDGTNALHGATNGIHYVGSSGTLTWNDGDTTPRTLTFPILPFGASNGYRDFIVQLSNPTNGAIYNPYKTTVSLRPPGNPSPSIQAEYIGNTMYSIDVQPDGKILIGGTCTNSGSSFSGRNNTAGRFTRLNPDGSRDWSFVTSPGANNTVKAIRRQPDGKILITGDFSSVHGVARSKIARLNEDGTLDTGFVGPSFDGDIQNLQIQPDGKVIVVGDFRNVNGSACLMCCRLNTDGSLDFRMPSGYSSSFNIRGIALDNYSTGSNGIRVFIGGDIYRSGTNGILCLKSDGTVDPAFRLDGAGVNNAVTSLAIQPDGKLLVGGYFSKFNNDTNYASMVRLNPDGTQDMSFKVNLRNNSSVAWPYVIIPQADGKILIGGYFNKVDGATNKNLARLTSTGSYDPTWDNGTPGNVDNGAWGDVSTMIMGRDGRVLVGCGVGYPARGGSSPVQALYTGITNQFGTAQFAAAQYTARPGHAIAVPVSRVNGASGPVRCDYSSLSGTPGTNFSVAGGTLQWTDGDNLAKTITITPSITASNGSTMKINLGIPNGGVTLGSLQQIAITVDTNFNYNVWRTETFSAAQQLDDTISGITAAPAGDGVNNLLKYALDLNPFVAAVTNLPSAVMSGDRLRMVFQRDPIRSDLTYEVQASDDLVAWSPIVRSIGGSTANLSAFSVTENPNGSLLQVTVDDSASSVSTAKRFLRLRLSK